MRAKKIGKLCVDITMLAVSGLLMAAERTGIAAHMLLGAGMLVLALIHNLLNLPWWGSLGKGRYDRPRRLHTAVNLLLLADLLAALVSGLCFATLIHRLSALFFLALVIAHVWMHGRRRKNSQN